MSDNIPFEIQVEIISKLPVKSLIQFRSVSKKWKSLIDSPDFISAHALHQTLPQHLLVSYIDSAKHIRNYVFIVDDDVTFPHQKSVLPFPLSVNQLRHSEIIGTSNGLICLEVVGSSGVHKAVIWNPSIQKSVNVSYKYHYRPKYLGFGVCPDTLDPKIVTISFNREAEVFTLSSRIWRRALCSDNNVPHELIQLKTPHLNLCGIIYWLAFCNDEYNEYNITHGNSHLIISFDLVTEEFTEMCLPDSLSNHPDDYLSLTNLRESLVVLQYYSVDNHWADCCDVWMMEPSVENSFRILYTITVPHASVDEVLGFRKNGAPIIDIGNKDLKSKHEVAVYDPDIELISKIGVDGEGNSVFGCFYVETLLLLGH